MKKIFCSMGLLVVFLIVLNVGVNEKEAFGSYQFFKDDVAHQRIEFLKNARLELMGKSAEEKAIGLVEAVYQLSLVAQKSPDEMQSNIPDGTKLVGVEFPNKTKTGPGNEIHILLDFPDEFVNSKKFTEYRMFKIGKEFELALFEEDFDTYYLFARNPKTGEMVDFQEFIPKEEIPKWDPGIDYASEKMSKETGKPAKRDIKKKNAIIPVVLPGWTPGALSGKTIYINQSHGWFDDFTWSGNRWRIQRGNCFGIVEDFDSPEFLNMYVVPLLRNAGAKVQTVREMDLQTNMVIVDNADGTTNPSNGTYVETGNWSSSTINGFVQKTGASWNGVTINPFNQGSGQNRLCNITTGSTPTGTATWTAVIPEDGYYNVYASWAAYSARAEDAQYLVYHSGGVTEVRMNQTIDGYTWNLLGNFYFEASAPADQRKVVLTNQSSDTTATNVSSDAIRWGGGMGDVARHTNGVSGRPRWEEEAVIHLQWNGFGYSGTSYTGDDDESGGWSDRPQFAGWEHSGKDGSVEDALYFAFHTNALSGCASGSSAARGLSTFRHSTATTESYNFQYIMHDTIYDAVESLYIPGWTVRSKSSGNYGENNQSSLGTGLPGFLIEGLFHDNEYDCAAYCDPKFRYLYGRAMVQGIIKYFEDRDSINLTFPPETPQNLRVIAQGNGNVQISWDVPEDSGDDSHYGDPATSYRVYKSTNGFGFDNGTPVAGTSTTMSGLSTGSPTFFRVVSVNAGGYSLPTETLAASEGESKVLIVNGFDRNEESLVPNIAITNAGSDIERLDPRTFQAFDYIVEHANSLAPTGVQISSCANEAVTNGNVTLSNFDAIFWITGEEATTDETLSTSEQTAVSNYLAVSGKCLFISGAEIGWDLDYKGTTAEQTFFNGVLKSDYVGDDAGTYNIAAPTSGPFAGLGAFNFDPSQGARYDAEWPDQINPSGGSSAALTYSGGSGGTAGIYYSGTNKVILLGFPFETISSEAARDAMMSDVVDFFDLTQTVANYWMLF